MLAILLCAELKNYQIVLSCEPNEISFNNSIFGFTLYMYGVWCMAWILKNVYHSKIGLGSSSLHLNNDVDITFYSTTFEIYSIHIRLAATILYFIWPPALQRTFRFIVNLLLNLITFLLAFILDTFLWIRWIWNQYTFDFS